MAIRKVKKVQIVRMAKEYAKAAGIYQQFFKDYMAGLPALPEERFWDLNEVLLAEVKAHRSSKDAVSEFFRKANNTDVHYLNQPHLAYTTEEAIRFANQYEDLTNAIREVLDAAYDNGMELGLGDDSFGDLCDALPLAGIGLVNSLFAGKYKTAEEFWSVIKKSRQQKYIIDAELMLSFFMNQQAATSFVYQVAGETINKYHATIGD